MDPNQFSAEECAGNNEIFNQLFERLNIYVGNHPESKEEAESLRQSFIDLQNLYDKGKAVWFDQYRMVFQKKIMAPALNGIRSDIVVDFNRIYTRLSKADRLMLAEFRKNSYAFPVYNQSGPEQLLKKIENCISNFCKAEYGDKGIADISLNTNKTAMLFALPEFDTAKLFRVVVDLHILQFEVLHTGSYIPDFESLRYAALACVIDATHIVKK
ncbi:hypothetical protein [Mucilaginibacter kameinonensis]|uniref:hypothetical protein n=1 Tax=Mucilaginibacter kameinonensis TaxID=452286 RepID=UPI000EF84341|nr:hypothetical protein [Mucilaginibacter kameinonensis]